MPSTIAEHYWALQGKWKADAEHITALEKDASLRIHFHASKVFLVLGTQDNTPVQVEIRLNGTLVNGNAGKDAPHGVLTVNHHALYELVSQADTKSRMLEITSKTPGLEAYAFTFGD